MVGTVEDFVLKVSGCTFGVPRSPCFVLLGVLNGYLIEQSSSQDRDGK